VGTGRDGWERGFGVGFGVREQGEGTVEEAPRGCAETKDACSRMLVSLIPTPKPHALYSKTLSPILHSEPANRNLRAL
jgi:hypothetical protein